jgi:uncharacterized damage-inducible protein DinB
MTIAASLIPEFDQEMASTRKSLERVPAGKLEWRPHAKCMTMGGLATHIANLPSWVVYTIERESFDMAPPGADPPRVEAARSPAAALELFDGNVADARASLQKTGDERFLAPWSLLAGGETVFTMPRVAVVRSFVMNHMIHHRAQLGVYLRLNDVPVPAIYGPTADEGG